MPNPAQALIHLRLGLLKEARALTINGAFIHQCILKSIEFVKELCSSDASKEKIMLELPSCAEGFYATESAASMESFIQRYLPPDYQQTMTTFANLSNRNDVMDYVDSVRDDYNSTKKSKTASRDMTNGGIHMKLIFKNDDASEARDNQHVFDILSCTPLKAVFTSYAEKRGVSLRSLRFSSYENRPLFPSQIGKKTLSELGMGDQDIIHVHDTIKPQENKSNGCSQKSGGKCEAKTKYRANHSKSKKHNKEPVKIEKTQEELKIEVSYPQNNLWNRMYH